MTHASQDIVAGLGAAILGTAADAILVADRNGIVQFWNPGATRIFGFAEEDAVGASLDLIIPEHLRKRHWDGYARVMEDGVSRYGAGEVLTVPAITKDGREISIEFTIILLPDADGRIAGMAAILRDVTAHFEEVRRLKRQLADRNVQVTTT